MGTVMDIGTGTSPSAVTLDGPTGQAQVLMLRDALNIEKQQSASLVDAALPQAPPASLEQGKGVSFDAYA
jgi:hypothetical protein